MQSNETLESAVSIFGYLIPGLEEVYSDVLFVGDNRTQVSSSWDRA